jgi:hypothetical protein
MSASEEVEAKGRQGPQGFHPTTPPVTELLLRVHAPVFASVVMTHGPTGRSMRPVDIDHLADKWSDRA